MKKLIFLHLCLLMVLPAIRAEDWELVYPEEYPVVDKLPFYSVGNRNRNYMIGSQSGFVLLDYWDFLASPSDQPAFTTDRGGVLKLPVPFDIHAVSSVQDQWILGGPRGQVALHTATPYEHEFSEEAFFPYDLNYQDWLLGDWEFTTVPTDRAIVKFAVLGNQVLALADVPYAKDHHRGESTLFSSPDKGQSWTASDCAQVFDVIQFNGAFYILTITQYEDRGINGWITTLGLLRSPNATEWELVWEVAPIGSAERGRMMVLGDTSIGDYWWEDFPGGNRLFIHGEFDSLYRYGGGYELSASTTDGDTWFDNGSRQLPGGPYDGQGLSTPWNPLELPEEFLFNRSPNWDNFQQVNNHYRVNRNQVEVYQEQEWIDAVSSRTDEIYPETISLWTDVSFLDGSSQLVTLQDDEFALHPAPEIEADVPRWEQLVTVNGTTYLSVGLPDLPIRRSELAMSEDLTSWTKLPLPTGAGLVKLVPTDRSVAAFYTSIELASDKVTALSIWDGAWTDPIVLPPNVHDVTFHSATQSFYGLRTSFPGGAMPGANSSITVERIDLNGSREVVESFLSYAGVDDFMRLSCPDGENLFVFGDRREFAVINPSETLQVPTIPEDFFYSLSNSSRIDSIAFANGWYYFFTSFPWWNPEPIDGLSVRTKDFIEFETVQLPRDLPLKSVIGFGDHLYGFVSGAVYRRPMEKGYLDSIVRNQGWRHNDWLGWFEIRNEEDGTIDHLLLGECWVSQMADNTYWIRTEALGWIWMNKDWAPWLYRLDDGHWYWLDQDSWPPRAWDDTAKEWMELP
jgi:hypothetical protein